MLPLPCFLTFVGGVVGSSVGAVVGYCIRRRGMRGQGEVAMKTTLYPPSISILLATSPPVAVILTTVGAVVGAFEGAVVGYCGHRGGIWFRKASDPSPLPLSLFLTSVGGIVGASEGAIVGYYRHRCSIRCRQNSYPLAIPDSPFLCRPFHHPHGHLTFVGSTVGYSVGAALGDDDGLRVGACAVCGGISKL
jgi:ABC-type microcin C transport system permease subunit YejE